MSDLVSRISRLVGSAMAKGDGCRSLVSQAVRGKTVPGKSWMRTTIIFVKTNKTERGLQTRQEEGLASRVRGCHSSSAHTNLIGPDEGKQTVKIAYHVHGISLLKTPGSATVMTFATCPHGA